MGLKVRVAPDASAQLDGLPPWTRGRLMGTLRRLAADEARALFKPQLACRVDGQLVHCVLDPVAGALVIQQIVEAGEEDL